MELEKMLSALLPGREICWLDETDSTNTALRQRLAAGSVPGTVVLAESQTAGRGRMGRNFASPKGSGLYFSLLLRPELPPEALGVLPALAAVAVRRVIFRETGLNTDIKWVNDLYAKGKKLCGILSEGIFTGDRLQAILLGIGLNCSTRPSDFPAELRPLATSIAMETGVPPERVSLAAALLRELDTLPLREPAFWLDEYRSACLTLNREVTLPDGSVGLAVGLTADYGLIVEKPGETVVLRSGEATLHGQSVSGSFVSP